MACGRPQSAETSGSPEKYFYWRIDTEHKDPRAPDDVRNDLSGALRRVCLRQSHWRLSHWERGSADLPCGVEPVLIGAALPSGHAARNLASPMLSGRPLDKPDPHNSDRPAELEDWLNAKVYHRLSMPIARALARTFVTPNMVSVAGALVVVIAGLVYVVLTDLSV